ncbi:RNA polymerase sigma factor [Peribacillus sp. SCS-37]|uniref:RNA polymerase sigma factor n=1 Tax=Paraperibacillus esterisolvens TaxID=3115296 RepID=UPI003905F1E5
MGELQMLIEDIYEKHFDDVYHYLLYFTNSRAESEDLAQETFIKVMEHYPSFRGNSSLKTWILAIARRTAIDSYRKKKLVSLVPGLPASLQKSPDYIPEEYTDHSSDWMILQKALGRLKPNYRNVVILRGLKEYSVRDTASILGWKESKVKVDYHRALKQLQKFLGKTNEGVVILNEQEN